MEVLGLGMLLAPLDQLVLEQGLEGLVLRLLLGVVAGGVGDALELLKQLVLRLGELGSGGLLGGRLLLGRGRAAAFLGAAFFAVVPLAAVFFAVPAVAPAVFFSAMFECPLTVMKPR